MAFEHKYSRLLKQEDFDLLNTQYGLELEFDHAADYRHAQVIWNLHCKIEEQNQRIVELERKDQKRIS